MNRFIKNIAMYTVLLAIAAVMVFPYFWMVLSSLKSAQDFFQHPYGILDVKPSLGAYVKAMTIGRVGIYLKNSLFYALVVTGVQLFIDSLAAYAFARLRFRGRDVVFAVVLSTMMLPFAVRLIPQYLIVVGLGLGDTYTGVMLPSFAGAFGIFMLRQFFLNIPKDLEDAARIDGCSSFGIYFRIILPLAKPVLITLGVFIFMGEWSSFIWPLTVLSDWDKYPLTVGISLFREESFIYWNNVLAASVIASFPLIILFLLAQRHIIGGISLTGLKGQ